ncbi:MAG: prolyl oligopeptidase family serine peptidase [Candidatus Obscuribacterales bacterium]|nr:prolyl oligopeptidase family serine peptidase [Candidatus Obscuribacterales bacterium]
MRNKVVACLLAASAAILGAGLQPAVGAGWSEVAPGILFYEATAKGVSGPIKVWLYLPKTRKGKIPCVVIPPAGTRLFHGMSLGAGDRAEHFPYVRAGFAVVSFDIEGPLGEQASDAQIVTATRAFMNAKGGVVDGQLAIDSALNSLKDIDSSRIMAAGHSSAGTTALALAASDKRIRACSAFAPCTNLQAFFGAQTALLDRMVPGFKSFMQSFSPGSNTGALKCPVFVFNAADDDNVKPAEVSSYVQSLKRTNKAVKALTVPNGGHYDSMIQQGIPAAIEFFRSQTSSNSAN